METMSRKAAAAKGSSGSLGNIKLLLFIVWFAVVSSSLAFVGVDASGGRRLKTVVVVKGFPSAVNDHVPPPGYYSVMLRKGDREPPSAPSPYINHKDSPPPESS
ncbi:unnamed protein product [Cuscuta europaea]|uniref:Uncharacterized protein n=1 Tax=Cuscuta europaea TaxID=41803 RepID=A0A9P0YNN2_CUSEU|nr:unnamed protein product [Cuscuta europaea]